MLHIAICEDEELYLKAIQEHLQELAASERYEIFDIHLYSKSEEQNNCMPKMHRSLMLFLWILN